MNPLPFHQNAFPAALAAMAAHDQGKFWEMHDKIFANQQALDRPTFERYAQELQLDMAKFKAALDTQKNKEKIEADQKLVQSLGAGGTPAFFINGRKLSGAQPLPRFEALIDEEMKKANALLEKGVRPENLYGTIIETAATSPVMLPAPPGGEQPPPGQPPPPPSVQKITIPDYSPSKGPKAAKVTIVEWSDFQCPFCSRVGPTLKEIEEKYGKDVRIVFRQQPLPFHPNAAPAAKAAMAAHQQGKFWEMHDKLFANQQALGPEKYLEWAKELKLDVAKFKAAMESPEIANQVKKDSDDGNSFGANGTPAFFINGRSLSGAQPFPAFKAMIDEELKKADDLMKTGVKLEQVYEKLTSMAPAPVAKVEPKPVNIEIGNSPAKGPKNAPVKIIAFSDFQCPFCSRVLPAMKQIEETYKGKVQIAFKQYPLPFHDKAQLAAEASLAAHEQGKFWQMHDKLFANQSALTRPDLEKYAQELGLDMAKFKAALDSGKFKDQVTKDMSAATSAGVSGTPSFLINGKLVVGALPFDQFKSNIDAELSKK